MPINILTRDEASTNLKYWSLMNFFMGSVDYVCEWEWIQARHGSSFTTQPKLTLFRGLYFETIEERDAFVRQVNEHGYTSAKCSHWSESVDVASEIAVINKGMHDGVVISATFVPFDDCVFAYHHLENGLFDQIKGQKEIVIRPLKGHKVEIV